MIGLSLCVSGCAMLTTDASAVHAREYPQTRLPVQPARNPVPATQAGDDAADRDVGAAVLPDEADRLVFFESQRGAALGGTGDRNLEGRTLRLNFVDAPVADAVRTIIGDALGQTVLVAAGVEGRITLTSPEPAPVSAALSALEAVLTDSGLALVERDSGFLLTRAEAARPNMPNASGDVGQGGRIIAIRNTDPSAILDLIDPFLTERVTAVAMDQDGVLVLAGPGAELRAAEDAIRTFDRPFLTDRVFGMFELRYANAETVRSEVALVLGGMGGSENVTQTIALPRLNLLFVTTRDRARFDQVADLVARFDRPAGGDARRLRYYVARNAPAATLAAQITAAFAGGAAGDGASFQPSFAGDSAARDGASGNQQESRLAIIPDQLNNALIIRATDQEYREILELVQRMDVMPPQVLIEATIAEVRLTDGLSFGVRWFFDNQTGDGAATTSFTDDVNGTANPIFPGFNYAFSGADLTATLSALNSITDVTVLSAPSIMVQNNQTAHLQVGDEVPIVTQTATSVTDGNAPLVSSIELRETGVILEVTPRINANGMVVLDVNQEVSSVRPTTTSGIDSPTIQKLEFTSTVAVRSANTIALGGLIRETRSDNESGIPLLGRIPGLGNVFKNRDITSERSELVIFLTPRIISNDTEAADALVEVRRELRALEARLPDLFDE
ncbi:type II secretion system secretin GspD [Maricaulis sp.]|uniref:type II secretion system secretin GspD n=1 Tax=Maricaulis sp. TaxID=1486257 RepID=UPI0025BFD99D|nr:type II secretion system secretin GspD [Maricaulis sp.]